MKLLSLGFVNEAVLSGGVVEIKITTYRLVINIVDLVIIAASTNPSRV